VRIEHHKDDSELISRQLVRFRIERLGGLGCLVSATALPGMPGQLLHW